MSTPNHDRLSILQRIRGVALRMQNDTARFAAPATSEAQIFDIPTWNMEAIFPKPKPLSCQLEALGVDSTTAAKSSQVYISNATRIKSHFENLLHTSYNSQNPRTASHLETVYRQKYRELLSSWKDTMVQLSRATKKKPPQSTPVGKAKQVFNYESVPLLEKYFEHNAYPSAADRAMLSRKTGLTLRQIEVWFQNHRNRAKKAGKPLKRLSHNELPRDFSLNNFNFETYSSQQHSLHEATPMRSSSVSSSRSSSPSSSYSPENILEKVIPPSHAFPSPFKLSDAPARESYEKPSFSPPEWLRRPVTPIKKCKRQQAPDTDELCVLVSFQLKLLQPRKRSHAEAFADEQSEEPWVPPTYVSLPSGSHPALLKQDLPGSLVHHSSESSTPQGYGVPCSRSARNTAFLKYSSISTTLSGTTPPRPASSTQSLRRKSSSSSTDSSDDCPTPPISPRAPAVRLFSEEVPSNTNTTYNTPLETEHHYEPPMKRPCRHLNSKTPANDRAVSSLNLAAA